VLGTNGLIEDVALYRAATQFASIVAFPISAINLALAPQMARAVAESKKGELQKISVTGARICTAIALPSAAFLLIFGKTILEYGFGQQFIASYHTMVILCVGQIVNASTGALGVLMAMTGQENELLLWLAIVFVGHGAMAIWLSSTYGATGVAIAATIASITINAVLFIRCKQKLGISSFFFVPSTKAME
jgi:O-antigen/teichoic acid export membrane protein